MKLPRSKNKKLIIIIAAVLALGFAGLGYMVFRNATGSQNIKPSSQQTSDSRKVNDVNYSPPTDQDKKLQDQQKDQILKDATQSDGGSTSAISVSISRASQADAGQPLDIRTIVSGTSNGTCEVTLTKDGQTTVSKSFAIVTQATYSTCANAQIPAADFGSSGNWKLQVVAKNGSAASAAAILTVDIMK